MAHDNIGELSEAGEATRTKIQYCLHLIGALGRDRERIGREASQKIDVYADRSLAQLLQSLAGCIIA